MARFYGSMTGRSKTEATRLGTEDKPVHAHIRGWNVGIEVECTAADGKDYIKVYLTGGSNGNAKPRLVGTATLDRFGSPIWDGA